MAVPGSIVGVGKLITPGGQQGPKGDTGSSGASGGTSHYYDYDDFMGGSGKFVTIGNSGGASAIALIQPSTAAVPYGYVQLAPGTVAGQYARIFANNTLLSTRPIIWRALVNVVNAGASSGTQHIFGFITPVNSAIVTTGYYSCFYYQGTGGANWQAHVRSLTAATNVDTGVNVAANLNTWFDMKVIATSTSVTFYINGTLVATITTNIPTGQALYPSVLIANGASDLTNRSIYIDTVEIDIDTGVTGRFLKSAL